MWHPPVGSMRMGTFEPSTRDTAHGMKHAPRKATGRGAYRRTSQCHLQKRHVSVMYAQGTGLRLTSVVGRRTAERPLRERRGRDARARVRVAKKSA